MRLNKHVIYGAWAIVDWYEAGGRWRPSLYETFRTRQQAREFLAIYKLSNAVTKRASVQRVSFAVGFSSFI